jgi:AcrR family transcriptional regulator
MSSGKKLSKELRREQLLDEALKLVRMEGTGGLTLARLAEAAGVTKPIAYEHFETREGLLMALFTRIDRKTEAAVMSALVGATRLCASSPIPMSIAICRMARLSARCSTRYQLIIKRENSKCNGATSSLALC